MSRTNPSMISQISKKHRDEVDRPLPWDRAYYHWLRRQPRSTAYRDLSSYNSLLNRWVHDLEEPGWWQRKPESAEEGQATSDSRTIS